MKIEAGRLACIVITALVLLSAGQLPAGRVDVGAQSVGRPLPLTPEGYSKNVYLHPGERRNGSFELIIPREASAINVTLSLRPVPLEGTGDLYLKNVTFNVGSGRALWGFIGTDIGMWGRQDTFYGGPKEVTLTLGKGEEGSLEAYLKLPKNATVLSAQVELSCERRREPFITYTYQGFTGNERGGFSLAVGDVNGDGWTDFLVGSPDYGVMYRNGRAQLFFGGSGIDLTPDLTLLGSMGEMLGYGALICSFDSDRYDDLVVSAPSRTGSTYGTVKCYRGSISPSTTPTFTFREEEMGSGFGLSVATGDFNSDGYDDVAVGAPDYDGNSTNRGAIYIYLGGISPDSSPDLRVVGEAGDRYGISLTAGDFDGDGYDDLAILGSEEACVLFGNTTLDSNLSVVYNLSSAGITGYNIECLGDINGDGYDDVGMNTGGVVLIVWGADRTTLLNSPSSTILPVPRGASSQFGTSMTPLGDFDRDGLNDFAVGDPGAGGGYGRVYVYRGVSGTATPALYKTLQAQLPYQALGRSLAAADFLRDGWVDIVAGGDMYSGAPMGNGSFTIFEHRDLSDLGDNRPELFLGGITDPLYSNPSVLNTTVVVSGWEDKLNTVLNQLPPMQTDSYGNSFVTLLLRLEAHSEGLYRLANLSIIYDMEREIDATRRVRSVLENPSTPSDPYGYVHIASNVVAESPGGVNITVTNLTLDTRPWLIEEIPDLELEEDGYSSTLLNLRDYFEDDRSPFEELNFTVKTLLNATRGRLFVTEEGYLGADLQNGSENDNWYGNITAYIVCTDPGGLKVTSNIFTLHVYPVNDPPYVFRSPPAYIDEDEQFTFGYYYEDVEGDPVTVRLVEGPENMTIDENGTLYWTPTNWDVGPHNITVELSDGKDSSLHTFHITVNNTEDAPVIISSPPTIAYVGHTYYYNVTAYDIDLGDVLTYFLYESPPGMKIDSQGRITYLPTYKDVGDYEVIIGVSDGIVEVRQNYTLKVRVFNLPPEVESPGRVTAWDLKTLRLQINATDPNLGDQLRFTLTEGPEGMEIDTYTGVITWTPTPDQLGVHNVTVVVTDGQVNVTVTFQVEVERTPREFTLKVTEPREGETISGVFYVKGSATVTPGEVEKVEVRVDGGEWKVANGTAPFRLRLDAKFLEAGPHLIEVRCTDGYVYSNITAVNITVRHPQKKSPLIYVGVVAVAAAAGAGGFLFFRRFMEKKKEEEERRRREEEAMRFKEELERDRERIRRGEILERGEEGGGEEGVEGEGR